MGPRIIVIKKVGTDHSYSTPTATCHSRLPGDKFIDPTGAGDSYAGALIGYLASANSTSFPTMKKAVAYATAVSSLTVESFSVDRLSAAGHKVIDQRYRALSALTRF